MYVFSVKDLTKSGDKMKFWSPLEFYFNLCQKDKGGGGVNVSVLTRGFLCDVCLFVYKGISFSGGDTNFYLFLQINWHWQIQISLTKEKYNYCSCLVIIIGETPPGAGAGAVAEA